MARNAANIIEYTIGQWNIVEPGRGMSWPEWGCRPLAWWLTCWVTNPDLSGACKGSTSAWKQFVSIYSHLERRVRNDVCCISYLSRNGRRKPVVVECCMDFHQCTYTVESELILPAWSHYSLHNFAIDNYCLIKGTK